MRYRTDYDLVKAAFKGFTYNHTPKYQVDVLISTLKCTMLTIIETCN